MAEKAKIRLGLLKFMYIYTAVGAGGFGLGMLCFPGLIQSLFRFPAQDPVVFGLLGSIFAALGLVAIPGIKAPLRFIPLLLCSLIYKSIWFLAIVLPLFLSGQFPLYVILLVGIFASYVVGDLVAIPFGYLLSSQADV